MKVGIIEILSYKVTSEWLQIVLLDGVTRGSKSAIPYWPCAIAWTGSNFSEPQEGRKNALQCEWRH